MKSVLLLALLILTSVSASASPVLTDEIMIEVKQSWDHLILTHDCCTKSSEVLDMSELSKYEDDYELVLKTIYNGQADGAGIISGGNASTMKMFLENNAYPLKLEDLVGVKKDGFLNGVSNILFGNALTELENAFNDLLRVNEDVFPDQVYNVYQFSNDKIASQALVFINRKTNEVIAIYLQGGDPLAAIKGR